MKEGTFAYDVLVNLLANLIAAGILYLLGVWFDLLPVNARVIAFLVLIAALGGRATTILIIRRVAYGGRA